MLVKLLGMEQDEGGWGQTEDSQNNLTGKFIVQLWVVFLLGFLVALNNVGLFLKLLFVTLLHHCSLFIFYLTFFCSVCMLCHFKKCQCSSRQGLLSSHCPFVTSCILIASVTICSFMIPKTIIWAQIFLLSFRPTFSSVCSASLLRSLRGP